MKSLEYYMSLDYPHEVIKDEDEGGYVLCFPDLPGCLTCGETEEQVLNNSVECKIAWFSACIADNIEIPIPNSKHIVVN